MATAYSKGKEGERLAAMWLRLKGYRIIAERYKTPYGEIDLVAKRGSLIAFIEVKATKTVNDGLYAITPRQQQRIANAAQIWIQENAANDKLDYRFDALIVAKGKAPQHITNAWQVE
jgi:putative endonuclease